jgi:CRISPR-associated protein Cas2
MQIIVLYDITNDRIRLKVAETCLDYGLDRQQYSAFIGDLTRSQQRELMHRLADLLADQPGAILLIPIRSDEWDARIEVVNAAPADATITAEPPSHDPQHPF